MLPMTDKAMITSKGFLCHLLLLSLKNISVIQISFLKGILFPSDVK